MLFEWRYRRNEYHSYYYYSKPNTPQFYGPADCHIGSIIEVFGHRFVITNADEFVLTYMKEHQTQFPGE